MPHCVLEVIETVG